MCTTFTIKTDSELIFGRNLDVETDIGNVFINPVGIKKTAYFSNSSRETPAEWKSKFGSITFNQISKDIPHGGMNEKGLVVEHLFLEDSMYERTDERPAIISHQWVQFMLDNCETVNEIIESCSEVRISEVDYKFPIHFNTMDRNGGGAIFEFLNGNMLVYANEVNASGVLSNSTFENSLKQTEFINCDSKNTHPTDLTNSIERFWKANQLVKKYKGEDVIKYSFSILDAVFNNTQWQIVYDISGLKIYYRTKSHKKIKTLDINDYDFLVRNTRFVDINEKPESKSSWKVFNASAAVEMINLICDRAKFIREVLGKEKMEIGSFYGSA